MTSDGDKPALALDSGLRSLESDMTLIIHAGTHTLQNTILVRGLSGVILQGNGLSAEVTITCQPGVGLAFFNVLNLQIRNVTIRGCGISQGSWDLINTTLYSTFNMTFEIPRTVQVGVLLAACTDMTLENFSVARTRGIGLLAISPLGTTNIRNVSFRSNTPPECPRLTNTSNIMTGNYSSWIGGGAYILFQDYRRSLPTRSHRLVINGGEFIDNMDCSINALLENFLQRSLELADLGYTVGAGGGLSVMMVQLQYTVRMSVTDCRFEGNVARSGAGLHVGVFSGIPSVTTIQLRRCNFSKNGNDHMVYNGGGMIINIDLVRPAEVRGVHHISDVNGGVNIDVEQSQFQRNTANSGGGVAIVSHYAEQHVFDSSYRVNFQNCRFQENQGLGGSALLAYEAKSSGFDTGTQLFVSDSVFVRNSIEFNNNIEVGRIQDYGVLHVRNINLTLSGRTMFDQNLATALGAVSSLVNVRGRVGFHRNRAINGAAMQLLSQSLLILHFRARIVFRANRADMFGGAIYVQMNSVNFTFVPDDCFLYFNQPSYSICKDSALCLPNNVSIEFMDNRARLGSVVYGSTLATCPWLAALRENMQYNPRETVYGNLQNYRGTLSFMGRRNLTPPLFSTETSKLQVQKNLDISIMPGEQFVVNVSALDNFNNEVPAVITSNIVSKKPDENDTTSVVGDFGFFEVRPLRSTLAPITVLSQNIPENVTIRLTTINVEAEVFLNIRLTECVVGFSHSGMQCVCDDRLSSHGVDCDTNFTVDPNKWLGPIHRRSNVSNDDLTVATCVLNYCEDGSKEVKSGDWDSQCREGFHRAGLLCGHCQDGYSVQLGTNACAQCTNWSLFLLVFLLMAGFSVVIILSFFQISVAEGFFVAIIFYSNIITLYAVYFNDDNITAITFLTSFLSHNFGIPACLYDGMDSLVVVTLQLAFVGYLFLLAILLILIYQRIQLKWIDSLSQRYSPSKLFATLIIMSYVSILQSCVSILSFIVVESFDGHQHIQWYLDPSVPYFQNFHAFLCVVAIILLFLFVLPPPILFTFCSHAIYRWRYLNKFKPLYDAFYAPFKLKFRPWLGFQLFVRIVLFIFAYFVPPPHHLLALAVSLIIYLYIVTILQPYHSKWVNLLESTLIVLALFYVIIGLYFGNLTSVSNQTLVLTMALLSTVAYSIIIAGFVGHMIERNPKIVKKILNTFKRKRDKKKVDGKSGDIELSTSVHPQIRVLDEVGNDMNDTPQQHAIRSASVDFLNTISDQDRANMTRDFEVSYTEYREPLLDEGEVEILASYSVLISPHNSAQNSASASPRHAVSPVPSLAEVLHIT